MTEGKKENKVYKAKKVIKKEIRKKEFKKRI